MSDFFIDSTGRMVLPSSVIRSLGKQSLKVVSHSRDHLLITPSEGEEVVSLVGALGGSSVPDLLSYFNMFRHTGVLRFYLSGGRKDLYFQQGEIVFAASSFADEDLGEILYRLGKVERSTLQKARQLVVHNVTVGKSLVEQGIVSPKDLWAATRDQVETIVYHLFSFSEGSFSFSNKTLEKESIVRLSMSTQNLIMEGLRRMDERKLFMRRIGSLDSIAVVANSAREKLTAAEERMLQLVEKQSGDVRGLVRKSGAGDFGGLRLLYQLVEKGAVSMEEPRPVTVEGPLGEVVTIFNAALSLLYARVSERYPEFRQEIVSFLRDMPHPFSYVFRDVYIRDDGSLDAGRMMANLSGLDEPDRRKLVADALSELLYMECMVARRELGSVDASGLIQRVQDISRRVKMIIGRSE